MHRGRRLIAALALVASPFLVAASDPAGDVAACPDARGASGGAPDLVSARGQIVEFGTSALWTLRFADDVVVPDEEGTPFRVDLVLRDPSAPRMRFAYYRDLNRLIRYDAVVDPTLRILLLPERGQNVFVPPKVEGDTMTIQVPGRILSADEDETGTSPGIAEVRWSVIVRDEGSCDLLGDGRPSEPMVTVVDEPNEAAAAGVMAPSGGISKWVWFVVAAMVVVAGGLVLRSRRRADD
ncbi:MAG TPA: hypothetical protein VI341_07000 [Actinomycetota bacterium]